MSQKLAGKNCILSTVLALNLVFLCAVGLQAQPVITQNPESETVAPGTLVVMSVAAQGTAPLEYRWQRNDRELSVRGPILRFVAGRVREGIYRAVVLDGVGRQTVSAPAEVKIQRRPKIRIQPRSTSVPEHGTAVFVVELNDSGPYTSIVWHNSNPLEGSHQIPDGLGFDVHSPRLEIPNCLNADNYNGLYWLAVTNAAGGKVSRKVRLTVIPAAP
jgi:hypothetical protein